MRSPLSNINNNSAHRLFKAVRGDSRVEIKSFIPGLSQADGADCSIHWDVGWVWNLLVQRPNEVLTAFLIDTSFSSNRWKFWRPCNDVKITTATLHYRGDGDRRP